MTESAGASPNPDQPSRLPANEEALALLLRTVDRLLQFLEPFQQRQWQRLEELKKALVDPREALRSRPLMDESAAASERQWAEGGPSFNALMPYVDQRRFESLLGEHRSAREKLHASVPLSPSREEGTRPAVNALAAIVAADKEIIRLFHQLQREVIAALDAADSADSGADNRSAASIRLPQNPDVIELARRINNEPEPKRSKSQIALELTELNERRAKTLLRQLRRYKHLLD